MPELSQKELEARRRGIGGSDAAAVCGLSAYRQPLDVYMEKLSPAPREPSLRMMLGTALEEFTRQRFNEETGLDVLIPMESYVHPEHDWMRGNLDGVVVDPHGKPIAVYEGKITFDDSRWEGNAIPEEYAIQGAHYMAVRDLPRCYYGVLFIGGFSPRFEWRVMERDRTIEANLIDIEYRFWSENVLAENPPEVLFDIPGAGDLVQRLRPYALGDVELTDPEPALWAEEYARLGEQMKVADTRRKELKAMLVLAMDGAANAAAGGYVIKRRMGDKAGYEVKPKTGVETYFRVEPRQGTGT